jgi:hypothetical protein
MTDQLTEPLPEAAPDAPGPSEAPTGPTQVPWGGVPRVNLLPLEIVQGRAFRRTQIMLATLVGGAVVLAAAGVIWAQSGVGSAKDELTGAQSAVVAAQAEQAKYASVPQIAAQLDKATLARSTAMAEDVLWYRPLNDLVGALPSGASLTTISAALSTTSATAASGATATDPITPLGIGSVNLAGTAVGSDQKSAYAEVAAYIDAVEKVHGLAYNHLQTGSLTQTAVSSTGTITYSVAFTMTVTVDSDALSGRYTTKAG